MRRPPVSVITIMAGGHAPYMNTVLSEFSAYLFDGFEHVCTTIIGGEQLGFRVLLVDKV